MKFKYIYLTSVEHSGSTLLACLLGAHPDISTVGEFGTPFPKHGKCSCGQKYQDCPFWKQLAHRAQQHGLDFDMGNLNINIQPDPQKGFWEDLFYYQFPVKALDRMRDLLFTAMPSKKRHVQAQVHKSVQMAKVLCEMEGTDVFLDTTKNPLQIRFLRQHPEVDLKVICLVRDGRGVMQSLLTKKMNYTPETAIDTWLWGVRNMERAVKHYMNPQDVFNLRLEDLCYDPSSYMSDLLHFIGLNPEDRIDCSDPENRHIVGNKMRFYFDGFIRKPDEIWKSELSQDAIRLFESKAGKVNHKYGYK